MWVKVCHYIGALYKLYQRLVVVQVADDIVYILMRLKMLDDAVFTNQGSNSVLAFSAVLWV